MLRGGLIYCDVFTLGDCQFTYYNHPLYNEIEDRSCIKGAQGTSVNLFIFYQKICFLKRNQSFPKKSHTDVMCLFFIKRDVFENIFILFCGM